MRETPSTSLPDHDVAVIGGGPAGLSAAVWAARHRRRVVLVDAGEQRNRATEESHGYLGFDRAAPGELLGRAHAQLGRYPEISVRQGRARGIVHAHERFEVTLDDGSVLTAARVVLTTGTVDEYPDIEGFAEHFGADVYTCPSCDGYEAQGRDAVVIGWGPHIGPFAAGLYDWARSVTIVTTGAEFDGTDEQRDALASLGITIVDDEVVGIVGTRGAMRSLLMRDGSEVPCGIAFFSLASHPRTELAVSLGCRLAEDGTIAIDERGETSVPGVYAAGDAVAELHLVQVAAASGAVAGVFAAHSLRGEQGSWASPRPAPDPDAVAAG
jgi:thioredoxin reductase